MREFVAEIRVPQTEEALLMVDPVGLSRLLCLKVVTPRGVAMKERTNLIPFPEDQRPSVRIAV